MNHAWEVEWDMLLNGFTIRIHGKYIVDAETGEKAVFDPKDALHSSNAWRVVAPQSFRDAHRAWVTQLCRTIERLSGHKCEIGIEI